MRAALRVGFWGTLAMGITTGIGHLSGPLFRDQVQRQVN
jgi:VIT1/CCC1 family predicted Fe2+/Mn2+ transporter